MNHITFTVYPLSFMSQRYFILLRPTTRLPFALNSK